MNRLRVLGAAALVVMVATVALPAQADGSDEPALPLESTWTKESCAFAAATAGTDQCDPSTTASSGTGVVSASNHLVSPGAGTVAWKALASAHSQVVATYTLAEPVAELDFLIKIRVNEARVAIAPNKPGVHYYDQYYDLGRSAQIHASAAALHSACSDCGGATDHMVLTALRPGTTLTTSGEDIVLHLNVHAAGGKALPPGEVTIRTGVSAPVWHGNTWGDDSASVEAVVERIILR